MQVREEEVRSTNGRVAGAGGWTTVIEPDAKWLDLRLEELWRYRDLVALFVRRDFVAQYKQTILGPVWHLLKPLFTTIAFTIVFGNIAGISTDGLPKFLFYMAGTVTWSYFAQCLTTTSKTFISNSNVFGKVYFPRLTVPVAVLISKMISFGIQFSFFLGFVGFYMARGADVQPNTWVILTPVLLALMAGLGLGFGIIVSSLTTRYRDLTQLVSFGTSLFMYATPVIYPVSAVPEQYRWAIMLNPVTHIVEAFRYAFLGAGTVRVGFLVYSAVFTVIVLFAGIMIFRRVERTFMDTV